MTSSPPPIPSPSPLARYWSLDPARTFLNHGSYGACPIAVQDYQTELRTRVELDPVDFMLAQLDGALDESRRTVAPHAGCEPEDILWVRNATVGLATCLDHLCLEAGDEVVVSAHEYASVLNELDRLGRRRDVVPVFAELPFPVRSPEQIVDAIDASITTRTRAVVFSHITSPSALLLPARALTDLCRSRGVVSILDAAHSIGQTELNLRALAPDFAVANLHKWACAPRGAAFIYASHDALDSIEPLCLTCRSHARRDDRPHRLVQFDYPGTDDPTPAIASGFALRHVASMLDGGWPAVRQRNHALTLRGRTLVCEAIGAEPPAPDSMISTMASIELPGRDWTVTATGGYDHPLQRALVRTHGVQAPIMVLPDGRALCRISAHLYNSEPQYEHLAHALRRELGLS